MSTSSSTSTSVATPQRRWPCSFVIADYNPTVLQLVTLPNFILTWALHHADTSPAKEALEAEEGELELTQGVLDGFRHYLSDGALNLEFFSGAWSDDFVRLLHHQPTSMSASATASRPATTTIQESKTVVLGAETIYSPFALQAFTDTLFRILEREREEPDASAVAFVAAKRLYFGVGGSLDDFVERALERGGSIEKLREETDGVRRGVVRCSLESHPQNRTES